MSLKPLEASDVIPNDHTIYNITITICTMATQQSTKMATTEAPGAVVELENLVPTEQTIFSDTDLLPVQNHLPPVQTRFITFIASDRLGYCL